MKKIFKNLFKKKGQNGDYYIQHRLRRGFAKVNIPDIKDVKDRLDIVEADIVDIEGINTQQEQKITNLQNKDTQQDINIANNSNEITSIKQEQITQNNSINGLETKHNNQQTLIDNIINTMKTNNLMNYKGQYLTTSTYTIGDVVSNNDVLYLSQQINNTNNSLTDKNWWIVFDTNSTIDLTNYYNKQQIDSFNNQINGNITNNSNAITAIQGVNTQQDARILALEQRPLPTRVETIFRNSNVYNNDAFYTMGDIGDYKVRRSIYKWGFTDIVNFLNSHDNIILSLRTDNNAIGNMMNKFHLKVLGTWNFDGQHLYYEVISFIDPVGPHANGEFVLAITGTTR